MRRADFPILKRKVNGKPLVYLDNASTSQKPRQVIEAIRGFYEHHNANVHRGIHALSEEATEMYEKAHEKSESFINASRGEVVFTRSTTESINLLANSLELKRGDEVLLTEMEHHSNIVPWQNLSKIKGIRIKYAKITANGSLDMGDFNSLLSNRTKIVSVMHVSNVLGSINPVKEIAKLAHDFGALFILDAAQSAPHMPVDAKSIGCDFMAFSSHKMLGPTGIGVLYGKRHLLEEMKPFNFGSDMIREVTFKDSSFNEAPWKFEAGTPNIADAIAFGVAIDYLKKVGVESILEHEKNLVNFALQRLNEVPSLALYGPRKLRAGLVSFNLGNIHPHDVADVLNQEGIAVRAGHHCAMPLMSRLGVNGTVRASFYLYNTKAEVGRFISALGKVRRILG